MATQIVTDLADHVLRIGWRLHSTAALMNTNLNNKEVVIFTFLRP